VIMPEGGANPCIIKVRMFVWWLCLGCWVGDCWCVCVKYHGWIRWCVMFVYVFW
jgi:hypothetical protein